MSTLGWFQGSMYIGICIYTTRTCSISRSNALQFVEELLQIFLSVGPWFYSVRGGSGNRLGHYCRPAWAQCFAFSREEITEQDNDDDDLAEVRPSQFWLSALEPGAFRPYCYVTPFICCWYPWFPMRSLPIAKYSMLKPALKMIALRPRVYSDQTNWIAVLLVGTVACPRI